MSSRTDALLMFERLSAWLREKGIERGPSTTELELAEKVKAELKLGEPADFMRSFYLPAVYGKAPSISPQAAAALLEPLCGPIPLPKPASASGPETGSARLTGKTVDAGAQSSEPDAGSERAPAAASAKCARCGRETGRP